MDTSDLPSIFDTPNTKSFQFNGHADGSVGQDVNQFNGTVSFSVPLLALRGRSGLNLDVTAVYSSSVASEVSRSNRDAPTSALGLGWDLLIDRIDADYESPGDRDGATFYLVSRGARNRMYYSSAEWQRASISSDFIDSLDQGKLAIELVTALLQQTLVLDASSHVAVEQAGVQWRIFDAVNEFTLFVVKDANSVSALKVLDGGTGYQLESFDYSRVRYYAEFERWEVVATTGISRIFGGGRQQGRNADSSQAICWSVRWNNWNGPSIVTTDDTGRTAQTQYPASWWISAERAPNRDAIYYRYQQQAQAVGNGGLWYTKAIYLDTIIDMYGRTAAFSYEAKSFSSDVDAPREFIDPYKAVPDDKPDAYQSLYQTLYLAGVTCRNGENQLLYACHLQYDLQLFCAIPGNAPPTWAGDRYKRVLVSIAQTGPDNLGLPPMLFAYHGKSETNAGAIGRKTLPEGATVYYDYQKKSLGNCARSIEIPAVLASAKPRVWFGADYVVTAWVAADRFSLTVYTWSGRWLQWEPSSKVYHYSINADDISADLQQDFFVVSVGNATTASSEVLFFHRQNRILGSWIESPDSPLRLQTDVRQIATGARFFAVADCGQNVLHRFTWSATAREWQRDAIPTPPNEHDPQRYQLFLGAYANMLAVLYYDRLSSPGRKQNTLVLNHLAENGAWQEGGKRAAPELSIAGGDLRELRANFRMSASSWTFAASAVIDESNSDLHFQLSLYTWATDPAHAYQWRAPFQKTYAMGKALNGGRPYDFGAKVQDTGLVACGPNLLRFDGVHWQSNDALRLRLPLVDDTVIWFAQGQDLVLKVENAAKQVLAMAQVYDPNTENGTWTEAPITLFDGPPVGNRYAGYYPSAGGDCISFDSHAYYRGSSSNWVEPLRRPLPLLPSDANSTTLINEAPGFMVYLKEIDGKPNETEVLLLDAGRVNGTEVLRQSFYRPIDAHGQVESNSAGKTPAGPGSFATYLPVSAEFDQAQSLTLYRYLNDAITTALVDFPVHSVTVDDGYLQKQYAYDFDPDTAGINPQGYSCKYYRSQVQVGDGLAAGSTRFVFINGVGGQQPGNPTQEAVLDGQVECTQTLDADSQVIAAQTNAWQTVNEVQDAVSGVRLPLAGSLVQLLTSSKTVNAVERLQTFAYDAASGALVSTETALWNGAGKLEHRRRQVVPAYTANPVLARINALDSHSGSSSWRAIDGQPYMRTAQEQQLYQFFPGLHQGAGGALMLQQPWRSFARKSAGEQSPTEAPEQWQLQNQINASNPYGYPTELQDATGVITSKLYSTNQSPVVATFAGASHRNQEAYYFGFESYEDAGSWQLDYQRTPRVGTICNTGAQSLSLPPGVTGSALTLTPANYQQVFLFSFWGTLDPSSGAATPATIWRISCSGPANGALPAPRTIEIDSAEWKYYCAALDLRNATGPVTITLTPVNTGTATAYIDNVSFGLQDGNVRARVFDPLNYVTVADVGPYNELTRYVHDRYQRQVAFTSTHQAVTNVIVPYLSRQDHPAFAPSAPNCQLVFQPMGATVYDRFLNNGAWQRRFSSPQPALWSSASGAMRYQGGAGGSITLIEPALQNNYAYRCNVNAAAEVGVGFRFGQDLAVRWDPLASEWHMHDTLNGQDFASAEVIGPAGDWAVVLSSHLLLFSVDGRVVFDYLPARMPAGAPTLTAEGPLTIRQFIAGGRPQLALKYFDGGAKTLQATSLEGPQAVVSGILYDAAVRPVIKLKPVPYQGASGARAALCGYRDDLVTAFDWQTGVLQGRAAQAYPDDQGYPYRRTLPERSPLARTVQQGVPGKLFAITGGAPEAQHTQRYRYGSNDNAKLNLALGLPVNCYQSVTATDPDGRVSIQISNCLGEQVASATLLNAAGDRWILSQQSSEFDENGSTAITQLPNAFTSDDAPTRLAWRNTQQRDLLGLSHVNTIPDAGAVRAVSDAAGRVRFSQNGTGAASDLFQYAKYDRLGRMLEAGLLDQPWDAGLLRERAGDPAWPAAADGARAVRRYRYGNDATELNDLGRLVGVTNYDEAGLVAQVSNLCRYDAQGKIREYTLRFEQEAESYVTGYEYDNLGNVCVTRYPSGFAAHIAYDAVGRVHSILDHGGQVLASYEYTADDKVRLQTILPESGRAYPTDYRYMPPGWLSAIDSPNMSQSLSYTSGTYDEKPMYSGRVGATRIAFSALAAPPAGFPQEVLYTYAYDERGQLQAAQASQSGQALPAWSLGIGQPAVYDANGNLLTVNDGGTLQNYSYTPRTDQVRNTDGSTAQDYRCDANGATTAAVPKGIVAIDYLQMLLRPATIQTTSNGNLSFSYDSRANRVRKVTATHQRTYIRSVNGWPLQEIRQASGAAAAVFEYLYGPQGIFALRVDGVILPVLTDHLHSVRGILDAGGKLSSAFHYGPFGQVLAEFGNAGPLEFRFAGYELDSETGLYNAGARLYDPDLKRFYSTDPKGQYFSPYLYCGNDPMTLVDPTGEEAWWALVVGALVGIIATVATGGALAPAVAGLEGGALTAATAGVAATAGAVGSIAGDATTAGIAGQKFTGMRALVDIVGGAAGGAAGELVGGSAASLAMRTALSISADIRPALVTALGMATAATAGGGAGALAQGAVTSAMTNQPFFTAATALNMAVGAAAGFGGALLGSGTHMGFAGDMPVPLGREDFALLDANTWTTTHNGNHILSFNQARIIHANDDVMYQLNATSAATHDVINMHGSRSMVYATITNGAGLTYERPMSADLLAAYIPHRAANLINSVASIKLAICSSADSGWLAKPVGATLATALGRTVWGCEGVHTTPSGAPTANWQQF